VNFEISPFAAHETCRSFDLEKFQKFHHPADTHTLIGEQNGMAMTIVTLKLGKEGDSRV
jgi:hypothetical protein